MRACPKQCRDLFEIVMLFQDLHRHAVPEIMRLSVDWPEFAARF